MSCDRSRQAGRQGPDAPARPAREPAGHAQPSTSQDRPPHGSARTETAQPPGDDPHPMRPPTLEITSAGISPLTAPPGRGNSCCTTARRPTTTRPSATDQPARTAAPKPLRLPRSLPTRPRHPLPAGNTGPSSGSSATAQRVKCARISAARSANLRSQPRTVSAGTPNRTPIGRCPSPAAFASIAAPITVTSSRRRNNATSASSTCVPAHPRHRARRGRNDRSLAEHRSTRSRPCPHGPNTPRHNGHPRSPPTSSASTRACSAPTINIGCHLRHPREPSRRRSIRREGSRAFRNARSLPTPPAPSPRPTARAPPPVPKPSGAQHQPSAAGGSRPLNGSSFDTAGARE